MAVSCEHTRRGDFVCLSARIDAKVSVADDTIVEDSVARVIDGALSVLRDSYSLCPSDIAFSNLVVSDLAQFSRVNKVYGQYFKLNPPGRYVNGVILVYRVC